MPQPTQSPRVSCAPIGIWHNAGILGGCAAGLYRITGNRCRSHLARRHTNDISLSDVPAPALADGSDTWAVLERGEQVALVERALAALPAEKREAFVLKHVEA